MKNLWILFIINAFYSSKFAQENRLNTYYAALPVPVIVKEKIYLYLLHVKQSTPKKNSESILYDSMFVSRISYPDGKFENADVLASNYNIFVNENGEIGPIDRSHLISITEYVQAKETYLDLVNRVIENKWLIDSSSNIEEQKIVAKELKLCWQVLIEDKLEDFYKYEAHIFLQWITRMSN